MVSIFMGFPPHYVAIEMLPPVDEIRRLRTARNLDGVADSLPIYAGMPVKTSRAPRGRRCTAAATLIAFAVPNAVSNVLARPGWRPALVMVASGFVGLLPASVGRAESPDFHHAPLSAASLENPYRGQAPAAQAGGKLYAAYCAASASVLCFGTTWTCLRLRSHRHSGSRLGR